MLNSEVKEKLRQIKIENYIWIIYIIIIGISYYSNYLEKDYFVNNNIESKKKYRETLIIIFSILLIIYLYFTVDAYKSVLSLKENDSKEKNNSRDVSGFPIKIIVNPQHYNIYYIINFFKIKFFIFIYFMPLI